MKWHQKTIKLPAFPRGYHLITQNIISSVPEIKEIKIGIMHVFIHHTSAGLTINENADSTVRMDFESYFNTIVPEGSKYYEHDSEGSDDMPAHLKASILGNSLTIPITNGKVQLGTWQGIYLCEHRNYGGSRKITITIFGEPNSMNAN